MKAAATVIHPWHASAEAPSNAVESNLADSTSLNKVASPEAHTPPGFQLPFSIPPADPD
jgi:hypothetical protein